MTRAAIGFRAHSGWAAAVAIAGASGSPVVIARRRIEMVDRAGPRANQPYHAAAELEIAAAGKLVAQAAASAARRAAANLQVILEELARTGHQVTGCGLLLASGRPLPALPAILASHALIHTAEGELFREALLAASAGYGLPVTAVKERDLTSSIPAPVERYIQKLGSTIGPPWRQDEKFAAMAAWLALHAAR